MKILRPNITTTSQDELQLLATSTKREDRERAAWLAHLQAIPLMQYAFIPKPA